MITHVLGMHHSNEVIKPGKLSPGDLVTCLTVWPLQGDVSDVVCEAYGPCDVCAVIALSSFVRINPDATFQVHEALVLCEDGSCGWASFDDIEHCTNCLPIVLRQN